MISHFKTGDYAQGLIQGILKAGDQLKKHFEYLEKMANNQGYGEHTTPKAHANIGEQRKAYINKLLTLINKDKG